MDRHYWKKFKRIFTKMMLKNIFVPLFVLFCVSSYSQNGQLKTGIKISLVATGIMAPVAMDCPKDNTKRLFICEQTGKIKIIKNGKILEKPFLDLKNKLDNIGKVYSEKGLLGIAFHPKYKSNGRFFVYYSAPLNEAGYDHKSIIAEYKVSSDADVAGPASQTIIMEIKQPESNHNGGHLVFGPDGFLYIGLGDGGGAGDQHGSIGNGQNLGTILGKILRINVDSKKPYSVPADNPFVKDKNAQPEIWAYGLRNPWRFSFDRKTGLLFCADVGQDKWEEIDIILKGKNYGWRIMEGNHCYNPSVNCNTKGLEPPIAEYGHEKGISVTGGYVYRGKNVPFLVGKYVFADWKGNMFYLEGAQGKWTLNEMPIEGKKNNDLDINVNSFGEDEGGELYMLVQKFTGTFTANGSVYLIEAKK
jgi:glucose/arabinose dehydrogenase